MPTNRFCRLVFLIVSMSITTPSFAASSKVETLTLRSEVLADNLIGIDPERRIKIFLPESYQTAAKRYPVIYYFHNFGSDNAKIFADGKLQRTLDHAIEQKIIPDSILVAGDFTAPGFGSFYGNAASSGRWMDHIVNELIPTVDKHFRTHTTAGARAAIGHFIGAYAALKLAMDYPGIVGAVYAMHPVGTATGETLMHSRPDWFQMNSARSWDDLKNNPYSQAFMLMAQAYLPNPNNPPFFADLMVEVKDNELVIHAERVAKLRQNFLLDSRVPKAAKNLQQLSGLKIDWGRYDENQDHVYANQKFTRLLEEYGVSHYAEEFSGNAWNQYWEGENRFEQEVIPFLGTHLAR